MILIRYPCLLFVWLAISCASFADELVGVNGERFVGKVISETTDVVVFESEIGGRLTVPRSQIRELQRTTSPQTTATNQTPVAFTNLSALTNISWRPPGVGKDGFDWIQLKSDEWLKG